jgi:hypothetical protein
MIPYSHEKCKCFFHFVLKKHGIYGKLRAGKRKDGAVWNGWISSLPPRGSIPART